MIQLESLRKKEHFLLVLKQKAVSNNFFSIYRKKNFIKNPKQSKKKLLISEIQKKCIIDNNPIINETYAAGVCLDKKANPKIIGKKNQ